MDPRYRIRIKSHKIFSHYESWLTCPSKEDIRRLDFRRSKPPEWYGKDSDDSTDVLKNFIYGNTLWLKTFYLGLFGGGWKNHNIGAWRTWSWVKWLVEDKMCLESTSSARQSNAALARNTFTRNGWYSAFERLHKLRIISKNKEGVKSMINLGFSSD